MRIHDVQLEIRPDAARLSARVNFSTRPELNRRLWVDWPLEYASVLERRPDPFAVMALPLSGVLGEPIEIDAPISTKLYHNLGEAAGVYAAYYPADFHPMPIEGPSKVRLAAEGEWASFYSGGVDSLYNIVELKRRQQAGHGRCLDQLWLVHGCDILLHQGDLWEKVQARLIEHVHKTLSQPLTVIRTNVRELYDPVLSWHLLGFSAALGGISKCVARTVSTVLIASHTTYDKLIPHAGTPLIDPLWSCEEQEIVHFTALVNRLEKIRQISLRPELLDGLRVCWRNTGDAYNCGKCEKCLRTQAVIASLGMEEVSGSFHWPMDIDRIRHLKFPWRPWESYVREYWIELHEATANQPDIEDLHEAIGDALARNRWRIWRKRLLNRKKTSCHVSFSSR